MARTRFVALMAMLALALPLRAQDNKDAALEEARAHAAKAKTHYQLGEFEQAAGEYIIVYRLRPIPILLYNIAQAYRQAGQYEKAKQFYKSYLRESPDQKAAIEKTLKEIDELLAKEKKTRDANPKGIAKDPVPPAPPGSATAKAGTPAQKPPETAPAADKPPALPPVSGQTVAEQAAENAAKPPPGQSVAMATPAKTTVPGKAVPSVASTPTATHTVEKSHTVSWVLAGTSVALLGGGGVFFMKASGTDSDLQKADPNRTRAEADSLISSSKSSHTMSAVLLGAGAAAAAAAVVFFLLP